VVTGANRGLGLAFVRQLISPGDGWNFGFHRVIACCRTDSEGLTKLKGEHPGKLHIVKFDLVHSKDVKAGAEAIKQLTDHVDVLVNNAARIAGCKEDSEEAEQQLTEMMQINCFSAKHLSKLLVPQIKKGKGKRIIMISSVAGQLGSSLGGGGNFAAEMSGYKISKTALNMAMCHMAGGLKDDQIIVVSINPGGVMSETMLNSAIGSRVTEENGWMRPEVAGARVLKIVDYITMADSGKFLNHRFLDEHDAKEYKVYFAW